MYEIVKLAWCCLVKANCLVTIFDANMFDDNILTTTFPIILLIQYIQLITYTFKQSL